MIIVKWRIMDRNIQYCVFSLRLWGHESLTLSIRTDYVKSNVSLCDCCCCAERETLFLPSCIGSSSSSLTPVYSWLSSPRSGVSMLTGYQVLLLIGDEKVCFRCVSFPEPTRPNGAGRCLIYWLIDWLSATTSNTVGMSGIWGGELLLLQ